MLSDEQKAFRSSGMGGTDVAELVSGSPLKVYAKKVDGLEVEDNMPMLIGRSLEPGLRALFAAVTGARLLGPALVRHPRHTIAIGSLDDVADDPSRVVEFKTANTFARDQWGDGPDDVPERYLIQCQWYMGVTGLPRADLAVLLGGADFRVYELHADPELFGILLTQAERFWRNHVVTKRPPSVDGSEFSKEWLGQHFSGDKAGILVPADANAEALAAQYRRARAEREAAEEEENAARNQLCALIGDAGGMVGKDWRISWKRTKDGERVDWESLAKAYTPTPAEIQKFTTTKKGHHVFRLTAKEK